MESNNIGRPLKFTSERMDQIRNLHEKGKTPEEIAEILGTTVGTLRVMCSRFGISLRRLTPTRSVSMSNGKTGIAEKVLEEGCKMTLRLSYGLKQREYPLELDLDDFSILKIVAEVENITLGELLVRVIAKGLSE